MDVKTTFEPGQKCTPGLQAQYGDRPDCVRYRHDKARGKHHKTAEIIGEGRDWDWQPRLPQWREALARFGPHERDLQIRVRDAGERWDGQEKLRRMRPQDAASLRLTVRIVALVS
jgi:hypothetical protein